MPCVSISRDASCQTRIRDQISTFFFMRIRSALERQRNDNPETSHVPWLWRLNRLIEPWSGGYRTYTHARFRHGRDPPAAVASRMGSRRDDPMGWIAWRTIGSGGRAAPFAGFRSCPIGSAASLVPLLSWWHRVRDGPLTTPRFWTGTAGFAQWSGN